MLYKSGFTVNKSTRFRQFSPRGLLDFPLYTFPNNMFYEWLKALLCSNRVVRVAPHLFFQSRCFAKIRGNFAKLDTTLQIKEKLYGEC